MEEVLSVLDWSIIIFYLLLSVVIGLYYAKKANGSIEDYFLSGRELTWFLAGTSMVATSFATDAPLAASRLVREEGLAGLWFPLSWIFADLLTLYFFARLWRRAHVTTDAEITELRYGGKPAAILRLLSGLYSALPLNCVVIGWVTLAMVKIAQVAVGWPKEYTVFGLVGITYFYTLISGLWGAVMTDLFQYLIATAGAIILAYLSVVQVGGIEVLKQKVSETPGFSFETFNFFPNLSAGGTVLSYFLVVLGVQWWAQKNVAGGGQLTQRMFACKDERHSMLSILWFAFAHYVIRPWPWMLVALASIIIYPSLGDNEEAYPRMIMSIMPSGLRGIMMVSMLAAFMSTLTTHLNWGTSYLVVDVYKRFIKKDGDAKHYVKASHIGMTLVTLLAILTVYNMDSIVGGWKYLLTLTAGVGPVFILRWYWHRINAWSEISALLASGFFSSILFFIPGFDGPEAYASRLLLTLSLTTLTWLTVTFLTEPTDPKVLREFYRKIRPGGPGWKKVALEIEAEETRVKTAEQKIQASWQGIGNDLLALAAAALFMIGALFSSGKFLLHEYHQAYIWLAGTMIAAYWVFQDMRKRSFQ